ncbi:putative protein family UPF0592 [Metarhizium album ARSEF 1941]|uniref:Protein family UPF0592 n=1 Tax=Metarhizium album (strain ARSEF 1941) TaxID=1081103 RepID=A0A0B2WQN1_METAS|nr:putative protein family UPF0592 [Metarhizium album ARSEF 1941]KHN95270.1 putative protein family UPF0592 [Metarhizium album ARSEF 1941]
MAPTLQLSQRPLPASELLGPTGVLSGSPLHHRHPSASDAAVSTAGNKGTDDLKSSDLDWLGFGLSSFNTDFKLDTLVFANGRDAITPLARPEPSLQPEAVEATRTETKLPRQAHIARGKRNLLIDRPRSWLMPSSKVARELPNTSDQAQNIIPAGSTTSTAAAAAATTTTPTTPTTTPSPSPSPHLGSSESLPNLTRRPWISRSPRPSSPKHALQSPVANGQRGLEGLARASTVKASKPPRRLQITTSSDDTTEQTTKHQPETLQTTAKPFTRATAYLSRIKGRHQNAYLGRDGAESDHSCASSATSLNRTSNSVRTSSAAPSICSDGNINTPVTDESCNEMTPKFRDPLWSAFKGLDVETRAFGSKQTVHRVAQIHSVLLPFLKRTRNHPSTRAISLEDVERRAIVLNKWWTALLDMLHGQLQQPIPGVDRPVLLEAATMLMMRPEWRQATTYMQPLAERSPSERVRSRSWTNASKSTTDGSAHLDMFAESAEHNVRTMFVANLVRQMAYVVDKMSLRHAPLSLVNFSGKTCAYTFFFAPGVADILLRLWGLTPELIRRAGTEFGLPRRDVGESDDITALFPPGLGPLGWTSPRAMWDALKQIPKMPLLVARIPWTGPWVARWKGRDTDLFFIFCKYFHALCDQFIPPGLPLREKARSPAFALVHAQLLSIVDSTIHRQAAMVEPVAYAPLIDSVNGADSALPLPLPLPLPPPSNATRPMGENKLAAASKTSLYDHAACFTLCDFLEEVLMVYHEFETTPAAASYIDWPFWIEVCKRMSSSMNTLSEVRMLSFVFTIWDAVAKDPRRKAVVCLDWLLSEETFDAFFNNWCPMVRAYYQRLICWRMCRYTGGSDELDMNIYLTAAVRLKTSWAHYLHMKQTAEQAGKVPPSTAPMPPAMGKKFMIIRQETTSPNPGLFMSFDSFVRNSASSSSSPSPNHHLLFGIDSPDANGIGRSDSGKKRWSLLGKVLAMTSGNNAQPAAVDDEYERVPPSPGSAGSDTGGGGGAGRDLADPAPLTTAPSLGSRLGRMGPRIISPSSDSLGSSPVFDEQKYTFKFVLGWQQAPGPARDRVLTRPRLPVSTQARISAKSHNILPSAPRRDDALPRSPPETPKPARTPKEDDQASLNASVEEWLRNTPTTSLGLGPNSRRSSVSVAQPNRGSGGTRSEATTATSSTLMRNNVLSVANAAGDNRDQLTKPIEPAGIYAKNSVYCGRALAEWAQVVSECNIFTERRQDDGVALLADVEVPHLGVEGFRRG